MTTPLIRMGRIGPKPRKLTLFNAAVMLCAVLLACAVGDVDKATLGLCALIGTSIVDDLQRRLAFYEGKH